MMTRWLALILIATSSILGHAQVDGTFNNLTAVTVGGIPQANQFAGADFCVKLRAANVYALANGYSLVDATHFAKTQACSVDPLTSLAAAGTTVALTDELPASHISTTIPWVINNNGLVLRGKGPGQTILDYTGASGASAIVSFLGSATNAYSVQFDQISGMSIIGGSANVTDGLFIQTAHHWKLEDVAFWGVTGCGVHTEFAVTPTLIRVRTSSQDASVFGYLSGRSTPASGLCLDQNAYGQTTDGTVIDAAAEYLTGNGFSIPSANSMTFTGGTSEGNLRGINIGGSSNYNTFIGTDLEANTANTNGVDINDAGASDVFDNVIATSTCSACDGIYLTKYWSRVVGGYTSSGIGGGGANVFIFGNTYTTPVTFSQLKGSLTGTLWQMATSTSICTTPTTAGSSCSSNITWPTAFGTGTYQVVCSGTNPSGSPQAVSVVGLTTTYATIEFFNGTASQAVASTYGSVTCWAQQ